MRLGFVLAALLLTTACLASLPVAYKGRFRPADTYARLWLYEFYHRQALSASDASAFRSPSRSALDFLWQLHFQGHTPWDDAPLFWIHRAELKELFQLDLKRDRFSYRELKPLLKSVETPSKVVEEELFGLLARLQLFEQLEGANLQAETGYEETLAELKRHPFSNQEIAWRLEARWPLATRLAQAGQTFFMLPDKHRPGAWRSLKALKLKVYDPALNALVPVSNFTTYSDDTFEKIRHLYLEATGMSEELAETIQTAYAPLAGSPYQEAFGKALHYPSAGQLQAERLYFQLPLIEICLLLYGAAACLALLHPFLLATRSLMVVIGLAFGLHTLLLSLRCYILMRPPVSNMFETVLYVPWVATLGAFALRSSKALLAAALVSVALLALLKLSQANSSMENVQAVLDSQYWLLVHVLMVVGSYGLFALCGILGHAYLMPRLLTRDETPWMANLAGYILKAMYLGVALLIPGTILGGVWAAESWGRFWDWDPKEAWAFISSCVYLLWIHAYRFHYIHNVGLAVGAIVGLQAIGFTWYGVNYILGTGLHSYGFGSGGELYYYLFVAAEALFLLAVFVCKPLKEPFSV